MKIIFALILSGLLLSSCSVRIYQIDVLAQPKSTIDFDLKIDATVDKPMEITTDATLDLTPY